MAVFNPNVQNLSPYYQQIINAINQRSELAMRPRPDDALTTAFKTAGKVIPAVIDRKREQKNVEEERKLKGQQSILGAGNVVEPITMNVAGQDVTVGPKKPSATGRKTARLEDPEGKIREVPIDLITEETDFSTFPWEKFPLAGFKPNLKKDERTGEDVQVSPSGKRTFITGPQPKSEGQVLRNDVSQLNIKEKKLIEDTSKAVETDLVIKKLRESRNELLAIRDLAQSGNEAAYPILRFRVIRGVGREVGALAKTDIEAGAGSEKAAKQIKRKAKVWITGQLPDEDIADFTRMADLIEQTTNRDLNSAIDQYVNRTVAKFESKDVDPELIKNQIDLSIPKVKKVRDKKTGKVLEALVYSDGRVVPLSGE